MAGEQKVLDLTQKQLLMLAESIYLQEKEKLYELNLDYGQILQYLSSCTEAWEKARTILNDIQTTKDKAEAEKNAAKISIARDLYVYSSKGVGISLQFIRSYSSRLIFMNKLIAHTTDLIKLLNTLNPAIQVQEVRNLAKQAAIYKDYIIDYERKLNNLAPNLLTGWNETGTTVDGLVVKYMAELDYTGAFEDLTDFQKLEVYESVIEAAGRGKSVLTYTYEALGAVGATFLVYSAATMVWNIATADNTFVAATREAVGYLVGEIPVAKFVSAIITASLGALEIQVATATIMVVGSIVGFGVGILIGAAAGELLDVIFNTGGKVPSDGLTICLVAPMPNGLEVARNIKSNYPDL